MKACPQHPFADRTARAQQFVIFADFANAHGRVSLDAHEIPATIRCDLDDVPLPVAAVKRDTTGEHVLQYGNDAFAGLLGEFFEIDFHAAIIP